MATDLTIEFDASSKAGGSGGHSWYGWVALDPWGQVVYQDCGHLGYVTSSNEAEFLAMMSGMDFARDLGYVKKLKVIGDSQLVINAMEWRDGYFASEVLTECVDASLKIEEHFERVTYHWVPRKYNGHADRLAQIASMRFPARHMRDLDRSSFDLLPSKFLAKKQYPQDPEL